MRQLAPVMSAALVLHCTSMATEGLLVRSLLALYGDCTDLAFTSAGGP
jgi:hypothetical protein